ncbi:MAG: hypothetical protein KDI29_10260, partial [Pseudomonadales bacterium]|nr:hypothetical protein [Pseudomonadales bacterium]
MTLRYAVSLFTALTLSGAAQLAWAHPGALDLNGGHYLGNSYHCHLPGCEVPDTFDRLGRDGAFTDYRDREKFFNEEDW